MRTLSLFATAAVSVSASKVSGSSLEGVVTLLTNLLKNAEKESKEVAEVYDKVACECRDTMRDQTQIFEAAQKEIDRLSAIREELAADSKGLAKKISKRDGVKANMEATIAGDYQVKAKETAAVGQVTVNFAEENAAGKNADIAELESINIPYLTSLIEADTTAVKTERAVCNERIAKCNEMMGACDKVLSALEGAQSKSIISMVTKLRDHAFARKTEIQEGKDECQSKINDLEKNISSSTKFRQLSQKALDNLRKEKADTDFKLGQTEEQLTEQKEVRADAKTVITETTKRCRQAALDFDDHSKLLADEVAGLNGAINALKKVPTPAAGDKKPAEFVQLASTNVALLQRVDESVASLATSASIIHSPKLAALAMQLRLKSGAQAPDYFANIRDMIVKMVTRLEEEQTAETSKSDWCAESLKQMKNAKDDSQTSHDDAQTAVRSSEATLAQLRSDLKTMKKGINLAQKDLKNLKQEQSDKNKVYTAMKEEKTAGEAALQEAIRFLKNIYADQAGAARGSGPSATVVTRGTNGGGVITMLEGIAADYTWDSDVASMEVDCKSGGSYAVRGGQKDQVTTCEEGINRKDITDPVTPRRESEMFQLATDIATTENTIFHFSMTKRKLKMEVATEVTTLDTARETKSTAHGLLDTSKATLKARQDACVNAGDSFEARQKRREEEVAALKEALGILEEHSKNSELGATFLQKK